MKEENELESLRLFIRGYFCGCGMTMLVVILGVVITLVAKSH
jgi:hypothetical protein